MSIPSFGIQVVHNGASTRIAPSGELDIATTPALEQAIAEATAERGATLVLDLRELTFMDSTGLRWMNPCCRRGPGSIGGAPAGWAPSRAADRRWAVIGGWDSPRGAVDPG